MNARRIQQLPLLVANQIAAGEVVERPASVVKELLENALDARATSIGIEIGAGGLNYIKVSDNGDGILAEDLPLAIAAHATSKISQLSDLYEIASMGFRGEALASIASVSKLSICSKPSAATHATLLSVDQAQIRLTPSARSQGTTIEVRDLFFNAPVRKKFLKTERLEYLAIEALIKRFALSAPGIALTLKHNDKLLLTLPAVTCERTRLSRIKKLMGKAFIDAAVYLDIERAGMRLEGFLSLPSYMRSQNDKQWIYVNQRMVKDKLLNHALKQVYEDVLYPGRHPACVLYLNVSPQEVDVNVHPTKHEVRFQEPRLVHDFMTSQLRETLNVAKPDALPPEISLQPGKQSYSRRVYEEAPSAHDADWTIVNQQFILLKWQQQTYLVDGMRLQQAYLRHLIKQPDFSWRSRTLLVPLNKAIDDPLLAKIHRCMPILSSVGMQISVLSNMQCQIKSLPILFQSLNIDIFFTHLLSQEHNDCLTAIVDAMISTQSWDAFHCQLDEQLELKHFATQLLAESLPLNWCRVMDVDACQGWLNV